MARSADAPRDGATAKSELESRRPVAVDVLKTRRVWRPLARSRAARLGCCDSTDARARSMAHWPPRSSPTSTRSTRRRSSARSPPPTAARRAAAAASGRHPVRFWNFVPGIHADMGDGLDRYMVFNAGRFAAFCDWFGPAATFNRHVPTASAVGIAQRRRSSSTRSATLEAGVPVENPRQMPAYSYSRRYGPLPPCFARATHRRRTSATAHAPAPRRRHRQHRRRRLAARARRAAADARDVREPRAAGRCSARGRTRRGRRRRVESASTPSPSCASTSSATRTRRSSASSSPHASPHCARRVRAGRSVPARAAGRDRRRRGVLKNRRLSTAQKGRALLSTRTLGLRGRGFRASASVTLPVATRTPSAVTSPSIL